MFTSNYPATHQLVRDHHDHLRTVSERSRLRRELKQARKNEPHPPPG